MFYPVMTNKIRWTLASAQSYCFHNFCHYDLDLYFLEYICIPHESSHENHKGSQKNVHMMFHLSWLKMLKTC